MKNLSKLEQAICNGMKNAQEQYIKFSSYPIGYGPESFIHAVIAKEITDIDHYVFIDSSGTKLHEEAGKKRGRPSASNKKRTDISVFYKTDDCKLLAAIEIKLAPTPSNIKKDSVKVLKLLGEKNNSPKYGYILIHYESSKEENFENKYNKWDVPKEFKLIYNSNAIEHDAKIQKRWRNTFWGPIFLKLLKKYNRF